MKEIKTLELQAIQLLKGLIQITSFSREEYETASLLAQWMQDQGIESQRKGNNVWAFHAAYDASKPTVLLNSHHDTVKPNAGYTKDPFAAIEEAGKLYGLGSNDAGGCLVSLWASFSYFHQQELPVNLLFAATAEEEISGANGISSLLEDWPNIDFALVGEPTQMQMAVAEKGLMVIDAEVKGVAGHAAREEGENAIYKALADLQKIAQFEFKKVSEFLGKSKVSTTMISAGSQHNVVPDSCQYTLDVRVTDAYSLEEALAELKEQLAAELKPRSMRLQPSQLSKHHLAFKLADQLDIPTFGSATLSDQALLPCPSIKIGPGDSARSHTADEFIYIEEIKAGITKYIQLLEAYFEASTLK